MLQTVSWLLPTLLLYLMTAVAAHLVMSFGQTLMHYKLGHHRMGGRFFHNHINFHHTYYSKDHLVSQTYLGDEGNNTPFFFIPVFLVGACTYLVLPLDLFVVQVVACAASFYAHVFFDKEYQVLTRATPSLSFSLELCTGASALERASKLSLSARDLSTARRRTQPSLPVRLHRKERHVDVRAW